MPVPQLVRRLSPRGRRWRRFLAELPLDPARLPRPLEQPGARDFIICGSARTGTSLLSAALFRPPRIVTVMEPWDGMRLPPAELFASLRDEIARTGRLGRGRLDLSALNEEGRVRWTGDGASDAPVAVAKDYQLGVKWPVFWRYLELLPETRFLVCLRHPVEVINSFAQAGGRVAMGLHYETAFNREMNRSLEAATDDVALRRVLLFDYIHERIIPFLNRPNLMTVRYERWFSDPRGLLDEIGSFLGERLDAGPAAVRPPVALHLSSRERELIRTRCTTGEALGYSLENTPAESGRRSM